jgi:hypothetical protein
MRAFPTSSVRLFSLPFPEQFDVVPVVANTTFLFGHLTFYPNMDDPDDVEI